MSYDGPYRLEVVRREYTHQYELFHVSDGRVAVIFNFTTARKVVDALNRLEYERAIQRVT